MERIVMGGKELDLEAVLTGKGVNAGEGEIEGFGGLERQYAEPGNMYSLRDKHAPESLDFIISADMVFSTKYHRILLKEWMNSVRTGGRIAVLFEERGGRGMDFLMRELFALFGNDIELERGEFLGRKAALITKRKPSLEEGDSIGKWSFGIVANGARDAQVDRIIEGILSQGIPQVQVIVCGKYANSKGYGIDYIPFSQKDELGWITRKKNLIMEAAKYENVFVIHDRIFLEKGWYEGMKRYGNYYDVLSCVLTLEKTGERVGDWAAHIPNIVGHLDYGDWDEKVCINGAYCMVKKSAWRKAPWNEYFFWNEAEDFELSERYAGEGIVPRFNPYSRCTTPGCRFKFLEFEHDTQKLGKLKVPIPAEAYSFLLGKYLGMPPEMQKKVKGIKKRIFEGGKHGGAAGGKEGGK